MQVDARADIRQHSCPTEFGGQFHRSTNERRMFADVALKVELFAAATARALTLHSGDTTMTANCAQRIRTVAPKCCN